MCIIAIRFRNGEARQMNHLGAQFVLFLSVLFLLVPATLIFSMLKRNAIDRNRQLARLHREQEEDSGD